MSFVPWPGYGSPETPFSHLPPRGPNTPPPPCCPGGTAQLQSRARLLVVLEPCDCGQVPFLPSLSFRGSVERGVVGPGGGSCWSLGCGRGAWRAAGPGPEADDGGGLPRCPGC